MFSMSMALYYSKNWVNFIGFIDGDDAFFLGNSAAEWIFFFQARFFEGLDHHTYGYSRLDHHDHN